MDIVDAYEAMGTYRAAAALTGTDVPVAAPHEQHPDQATHACRDSNGQRKHGDHGGVRAAEVAHPEQHPDDDDDGDDVPATANRRRRRRRAATATSSPRDATRHAPTRPRQQGHGRRRRPARATAPQGHPRFPGGPDRRPRRPAGAVLGGLARPRRPRPAARRACLRGPGSPERRGVAVQRACRRPSHAAAVTLCLDDKATLRVGDAATAADAPDAPLCPLPATRSTARGRPYLAAMHAWRVRDLALDADPLFPAPPVAGGSRLLREAGRSWACPTPSGSRRGAPPGG